MTNLMRGTLHEEQNTIFTILVIRVSRSVLLRMRNGSDKSCRDNQNTYFMFSNFLFENHAVYEIKWKNIIDLGRPPTTPWRMRNLCWIPEATNTSSEYVIIIIIIIACPL